MGFIVYILFSETKNRYYIGYTSNLEERIIRHNQKSKGFTGNINDSSKSMKQKKTHNKENCKSNHGKAELKL
jgi:putative endonuclease